MPEFTPEQQQIEDLVERCLDEAGNALETNEGLLFDAIMNAESLEDARQAVLEQYTRLNMDTLQDVLHRGILAAQCWGRYTVDEETPEEDADHA